MTEELFRTDAYLRECEAVVTAIDATFVQLDRTVFYPTGGGQPGDVGALAWNGGEQATIVETLKGEQPGEILHRFATDSVLPEVGARVTARIDWPRRHRLMRMHTCMHVLCAVVPAGVTGGSIRDGSARLDFDLPEQTLDKAIIGAELNRLISLNRAVTARWISDEEMAVQQELVRTMSVAPPSGQGRVRLMEIDGLDLQPCGGTHVANTAEIGRVRVSKIEKKGKRNRRVNVVFDD